MLNCDDKLRIISKVIDIHSHLKRRPKENKVNKPSNKQTNKTTTLYQLADSTSETPITKPRNYSRQTHNPITHDPRLMTLSPKRGSHMNEISREIPSAERVRHASARWSPLVFIGSVYGFRCPPQEVGRSVGGQPLTGDFPLLVKAPQGTRSRTRPGE